MLFWEPSPVNKTKSWGFDHADDRCITVTGAECQPDRKRSVCVCTVCVCTVAGFHLATALQKTCVMPYCQECLLKDCNTLSVYTYDIPLFLSPLHHIRTCPNVHTWHIFRIFLHSSPAFHVPRRQAIRLQTLQGLRHSFLKILQKIGGASSSFCSFSNAPPVSFLQSKDFVKTVFASSLRPHTLAA